MTCGLWLVPCGLCLVACALWLVARQFFSKARPDLRQPTLHRSTATRTAQWLPGDYATAPCRIPAPNADPSHITDAQHSPALKCNRGGHLAHPCLEKRVLIASQARNWRDARPYCLSGRLTIFSRIRPGARWCPGRSPREQRRLPATRPAGDPPRRSPWPSWRQPGRQCALR